MNVMAPGSIPVFLGNSGIGPGGGGQSAPQIIEFDVYYDSPVIVGFHVIGSDEKDCIGGFFAELVIDDC